MSDAKKILIVTGDFTEDYEKRNLWEWNYADYKAYQTLK